MDRQMTIQELQKGADAVPNDRTLKNYVSTLNCVNKHYGWESDIIYFDRMNEKAKEISEFIYQKYKISNTAQFRQKMSALSSLMTRTKFQPDGKHIISMMVNNAGKFLSVADTTLESEIEDWETLRPKLVELGKQNTICGLIARIFSYGYVLRVGEIFETRVDADAANGTDNYLDLDGCMWYIRKKKNGIEKTFNVDPELCQSLKDNCSRRSLPAIWLLSKNNGNKYGPASQRLPYHGWSLASNADIRKSYETWNRHNSGRTENEKTKWHTILGHNKSTVKEYYDTKAFDPEPPSPTPTPTPPLTPPLALTLPRVKIRPKFREYDVEEADPLPPVHTHLLNRPGITITKKIKPVIKIRASGLCGYVSSKINLALDTKK